MSERRITLTVNGERVSEMVEPRMELADFLRERLNLTGTHLGCEHGVCGACTVHIDDAPARSCITYAVACDGAAVTTIEGFDQDPIMAELRAAFTREHGLQCGYCTPGMLATARDIVRRLPDADERRIRTELSGNLCRCTGYVGIVRAIGSVLKARRAAGTAGAHRATGPLGPVGSFQPGGPVPGSASPAMPASGAMPAPAAPSPAAAMPETAELGRAATTLHQSFTVGQPRDTVWAFFRDVAQMAACMPGVRLTAPPLPDRVEGEMRIKLGPIAAGFAGAARIARDEALYRGTLTGSGGDQGSGSRVRGAVRYALFEAEAGGATRVDIEIAFALAGPLAQFSRGAIVNDVAQRLTRDFARNLAARMAAGDEAPPPAKELRAGSLFLSVLWARLKRWLGGRPDAT